MNKKECNCTVLVTIVGCLDHDRDAVVENSSKLSDEVIDYVTNVSRWELEVREYDRINHPSRTPRDVREIVIIRINKSKGSIDFLTAEEAQQNKI